MDHLACDMEDFLCDASFQRYCLGNDHADVVYWERWIKDHPEKKQLLEKAKKLYFELNGNITDQDFNEDYAAFKKAFSNKLAHYMEEEANKEPLKVKLWSKIFVAASTVLAISAGLWFYQSVYREKVKTRMALVNDVKPGKNIATMTLGNGQVINLSDTKRGVVIDAAKLSYNDGSNLERLSNGDSLSHLEEIVVATPRGGEYQVVLADGTKVWLNAASSIKFPSSFSGLSQRTVELSGEAYFEVAKIKTKHIPFVVSANGQEVEVLGTHFNINAYTDEGSTKTTLLEGLVRVSRLSKSKETKTAVVIHPGEQAQFANGLIRTSKVDVEDVIAWKEGYFQFNHADLDAIMREISRWYDVKIRYEGTIAKLEFGGAIQKNLTLSQVLKILNKSEVHFRMEGKEVIVMP